MKHGYACRWRRALTGAGLVAGLVGLAGCAHYAPKPVAPTETLNRLEARSLTNASLQAFLATNAPDLVREWPRPSWDLASLTLAAFYYHPSLEVARAQAETAEAGILTAGGRPNPSLGLSPEYNFNAANGATPWIAALQFDFPIETAGKRGLRLAQARHLSAAARWRLGAQAWKVRAGVRTALVDLENARQQAALQARQIDAEQQVLRALETKFAAGAATAGDLAAARLTLARAQAAQAGTRAAAEEARARLAAALTIPLAALPSSDALRLGFTNDACLTFAAARRSALTSRADLLAALAEYAAAESALKLEVQKQYPDLHLGTGYQFDQAENKWSLGLNLEVPVLNQNQGPIAEARARRQEAGTRALALQAEILGEVDRAHAAWRSAQSRLAALSAIRTAQASRLAALQAQLDAGAAEALDVLSARAELAAADLLQWESEAGVLRAFGDLEEALQRPLADDFTANPSPAQP